VWVGAGGCLRSKRFTVLPFYQYCILYHSKVQYLQALKRTWQGDGLKLGFHRVQAAKIVKRQVRECRTTEDGKRKFDGPVIREKGDAFMIDCNVTGANDGTPENLKFALLSLFRDVVFPKIQALVGPGGDYEGYTTVIQGDNAGPH
jgi:hypothetical protein